MFYVEMIPASAECVMDLAVMVKTKIILTITGGRSRIYPAFAGNVTNNALYGMLGIAQNLRGIQVPNYNLNLLYLERKCRGV
jgi:hypothetical protein